MKKNGHETSDEARNGPRRMARNQRIKRQGTDQKIVTENAWKQEADQHQGPGRHAACEKASGAPALSRRPDYTLPSPTLRRLLLRPFSRPFSFFCATTALIQTYRALKTPTNPYSGIPVHTPQPGVGGSPPPGRITKPTQTHIPRTPTHLTQPHTPQTPSAHHDLWPLLSAFIHAQPAEPDLSEQEQEQD